jgi:hypothetical protein
LKAHLHWHFLAKTSVILCRNSAAPLLVATLGDATQIENDITCVASPKVPKECGVAELQQGIANIFDKKT